MKVFLEGGILLWFRHCHNKNNKDIRFHHIFWYDSRFHS